MILNTVEKAMMNNPVRALMQRHFEAKRLLKMGGVLEGGTVLEVGCGQGVGAEIIFDLFGAEKVEAFDLDQKMVDIAKNRLRTYGSRAVISQGNVTAIDAEDNAYDGVFDFAIIHHVPNWRDALTEIFRVLKPGKKFYAEEILKKFILRPLWRQLLDHPLYDRFDHEEFKSALNNTGFNIIDEKQLFNEMGWYIAEKPLV